MRWVDTYTLAIELEKKHKDIDILALRFTDLKRYILALEGFNDDPEKSNEKILEAIQMAWLDERD